MTALCDVLELLRRLVLTDRAELVAVARSEGLGPEDAIDCVQEGLCTLLSLLGRRQLAPDEDGLRRYVARIVRNAARNRRRRHHLARPHLPYESVDAQDETPTSEVLLARAEDHVRVHACVARLCDTQRAVVTLRLLEQREGEDVAAVLGLTRGHVDVLLHRAKSSLRACLHES